MLLYVPRQLGGDVGHKVAAGPETVVVPTHPELAVLVGTETLQGVVSKLVSHVHQVVVGVDVVQAVGLGLAGGFADVLAVPKETVEVELVGILAVRRKARIAGMKPQPRRSLAFPVPFPLMSCHLPMLGFCSPVPGGAIKRNGPWAALLLNRMIQSVETTDPSMHSCLLFGALKVHKGLQYAGCPEHCMLGLVVSMTTPQDYR